MISKMEAIQKLKKVGYKVAEDNSVITILIPASKLKKTTIGEIKEKLKEIEYNASFSVRTYKETEDGEQTDAVQNENAGETVDNENITPEEDFFDEEDEIVEETGSLLSEDDDGQFSLANFGFDD